MDIRQESHGGVTVVGPQGRVDSNSARELEDVLLPLFDGTEPVLVDFGGMSYISSAGLRVLLLAARRSKATGIALALCGMSKPVEEVFTISGFAKLFRIHPTAPEAIAALKPA